MQQVAAANNKFLSSANLIFAAGDNSWIFMTPGQQQFGTAVGKVLVQRIATPAQRSAELARYNIAGAAQRSDNYLDYRSAAQRSACVNVPLL